MDLEMASPEEIIANVERMIKQEETKNTAMKKDKRSAEKALDLGYLSDISSRVEMYCPSQISNIGKKKSIKNDLRSPLSTRARLRASALN
jgi:hypothetical protein